MKKKVLLLSALILVLSAAVIFFLHEPTQEVEKEVASFSSFQCRGKIFSENLNFESKLRVLDLGFTSEEIEEIIQYQLMFGLSNFQYMPLETPLQDIHLRTMPEVRVISREDTTYAKDIQGKIELPTFVKIKKRKWPEVISENAKAIEISYEVNADVDYCMKTSLESLEDFPLYFPLDPIYAYYSLDREHWGYITNFSDEKSIVLNRCQNYHQLFKSDLEFSKQYWSQWNPIKRGKESHTGHYECKDWLKENIDYMAINPTRTKINPLHFQLEEKTQTQTKTIILKFITSLENKEKKSFYEVSIGEILSGKDFLYTLPRLSLDDQKLFKWIGELTSYVKSTSKVELIEKDSRLVFRFKGLMGEINANFELFLGETFDQASSCDFGISYSFNYILDPLVASSGCAEEFFYIPQSSLMHTLFSRSDFKGRAYFLTSWPSLADDSTGAYLLDFIGRRERRPDYTVSQYLEEENREDAFVTLPSFKVISKE